MIKKRMTYIGRKLNVSIKDIQGMKGEYRKKKFLYPLLLAIVGGIAALMGCLKSGTGGSDEGRSSDTYPYMIPSLIGIMGVGMVFRNNKNRKKHLILVLSALAILVMGIFLIFKGSGLVEAAENFVRSGNESGNFSEAVDYGVYSKEP